MEQINPYEDERPKTDSEQLAEAVAEYDRLNQIRIILAQEILRLTARIKNEPLSDFLTHL